MIEDNVATLMSQLQLGITLIQLLNFKERQDAA